MPDRPTKPPEGRHGSTASIETQIRDAALRAGFQPLVGLAHVVTEGQTQAMVRATGADGRVWAFALVASSKGSDLIVGAPVGDTKSPLTVIGTIQAQGAN
jgi:hypothetical protein